MKKYFLIIILLFSCSIIFAAEKANIGIITYYPYIIYSNTETSFYIYIVNNEDKTLYDLELSAFCDDNAEVTFDRARIAKIEPKENIRINVNITSKNKYYFDKDTFITYKISNNEFFYENRIKYTIKPVENFWVFIILSVVLLLIVVFVLIFFKLNKGEKDAG